MKDPYKALGVSPDASESDIKKAYRKLAKEYHPDRTGGNKAKEARFKDISAAYEILGNKERRAQYDQMSRGGGIPAGADLSEILAQMFGGASPFGSAGASPFGGGGVSFGGGFGGGSPFGSGGSPFGGAGPFGGGASPFGHTQQRSRPAPKRPKPQAPTERTIRVGNGATVTQRGDDIYSDVRISFDKAILGTIAEVPTLTGTAKVRIPAGTSSGQKLRLKGKGVKRKNPKAKESHGSHYVTIHIDVPKVEGKESSELLSKFVSSLSRENS